VVLCIQLKSKLADEVELRLQQPDLKVLGCPVLNSSPLRAPSASSIENKEAVVAEYKGKFRLYRLSEFRDALPAMRWFAMSGARAMAAMAAMATGPQDRIKL